MKYLLPALIAGVAISLPAQASARTSRTHSATIAQECIGSAIWHEARGEPQEGKIAVAQVIMNRVRSGLFARDPCAVIKQDHQFQFVRHGRIPTVPEQNPEIERIAAAALRGIARNPIRNALFFRVAALPPEPGRRLLRRIGGHNFYL